MTFSQILINDVFLLALILFSLFYNRFAQRRLEMKIANLEAEYDLLKEKDKEPVREEENLEKTSNDKTEEEFKAFEESVNKRLEEKEEELKKVIEVLRTVTLEIKNLKDSVREKSIDLEL